MIALIVLLVIAAGLLLVVLYVIGTYNVFVGLRNQVDNAWSQIDVQLKRRHDLIPNLVETAKGYMQARARNIRSGNKRTGTGDGSKNGHGVSKGGRCAGRRS